MFFSFNSNAENHNIYETIELIQKDIKTLEKAVYSGSLQTNENLNNISSSNLDLNSEDVLTRHLLKLSEIENQFQELTNRFEEINFKLDKLSNRLSKVQADNQLRFQELENGSFGSKDNKKITKKIMIKNFCLAVHNLKIWDRFHTKIAKQMRHHSNFNQLTQRQQLSLKIFKLMRKFYQKISRKTI